MRAAGIVRLVALAVAAVATSAPVAAQGFLCEYAPAIVSLSDTVLTKRKELGRFQKRNAPAAEAAYLKIAYAPLNDGDAEALLTDLIADDARGVGEVAFAWSFGKYEGAVTERMLGPGAIDKFVGESSPSAMRAMIREGQEDALMAAFAKLDPSNGSFAASGLAVSILDYSDRWKKQVAEAALKADLPIAAAALVATERKGSKAWLQFIDRLGDPALASTLTQYWRWAPSMIGLPELPRTADQDPPFDPAARTTMHAIITASMETPQIDFVSTLVNQSGNLDETYPASMALREALARGEIERDGPYGPAWLLLYRALLASWADDEELRSQLRSFDAWSPRGRGKPIDILDTLIAIEAMTPYMQGKALAPPAPPPELSPKSVVIWSHWIETAERVLADPADQGLLEEGTLPIAADLLLAAGNADAAASLLAAAPATAGVAYLAIDLAVQLDRLCSSYLYHPAEAVLLADRPIFKFDG